MTPLVAVPKNVRVDGPSASKFSAAWRRNVLACAVVAWVKNAGMKITSAEALAAMRLARGNRSWSQFAASAPRDSNGKILVRPSPQRVVAVASISPEDAGEFLAAADAVLRGD
jgi:hypothetical protein